MFGKLIDILKKSPKKIVFTEGTDPRILEASARLLSGTFLTPILIGSETAIRSAAEDAGFNIRGAEIYDPEHYEKMDPARSPLLRRDQRGHPPRRGRRAGGNAGIAAAECGPSGDSAWIISSRAARP